jgi:hypothetical protein
VENYNEYYFLNNSWDITAIRECYNSTIEYFLDFNINNKPFILCISINNKSKEITKSLIYALYASYDLDCGTGILSIVKNRQDIWIDKINKELINNVKKDNSLISEFKIIPKIIYDNFPELLKAKNWGLF